MHGTGKIGLARILAVAAALALAILLCCAPVVGRGPIGQAGRARTFSDTYTMGFGAMSGNGDRVLSFSCPAGWSVLREAGPAFEGAIVRKGGTPLTIRFIYIDDSADSVRIHPKSAAKVAESDFRPFYVRGSNESGLGPVAVAEVTMETAASGVGRGDASYYALLPESIIADAVPDGVDSSQGFPGFKYGGWMSFACRIPEEGITYEERSEVLRILSSLSNGVSEEQYERALVAWLATPPEFRE